MDLKEKKALLEKMGLVGTITPGPVQSLSATVQDLEGKITPIADPSALWSAYQKAAQEGGLFKLIATIKPHVNDGSNVNAWDIADKAYAKVAKSFAGQPFLRDHSLTQQDRGGTIRSSAAEGKGAEAYMLQVIEAVEPWAIEGFLKGTIDRFSIHLNAPTAAHCSVCGGMIFEGGQMVWSCNHIPGNRYAQDKKKEQVECRWIITEATGKESSAVVDPAVSGTGVEDLMLAARSMKDLAELKAEMFPVADPVPDPAPVDPPVPDAAPAPVVDPPAEASAPEEEEDPPVEEPMPPEEDEEEEAAVVPAPAPAASNYYIVIADPYFDGDSEKRAEAAMRYIEKYGKDAFKPVDPPKPSPVPHPEVEALKLENTRLSLEMQAYQKGISEAVSAQSASEGKLLTLQATLAHLQLEHENIQAEVQHLQAEHAKEISTLQSAITRAQTEQATTHARYLEHLKSEVSAARAASPLAQSLFAGKSLDLPDSPTEQEATLLHYALVDAILIEKDRRLPHDFDLAKEGSRLMALSLDALAEVLAEVKARPIPKAPAPQGRGSAAFSPQPPDLKAPSTTEQVEVKHSLSSEEAVALAMGRAKLDR